MAHLDPSFLHFLSRQENPQFPTTNSASGALNISLRPKRCPSHIHYCLACTKFCFLGTAWPQQWHATSAFTGNNLGLFGSAGNIEADVGDPTFVAFELQGNYYYDWPNLREVRKNHNLGQRFTNINLQCNVWSNVLTGDQSKTLIVNGTYYIVNLATRSCTIVPIAPVNGPLKYDWPTRIPYIEQQFLQVRYRIH